MSFKTLIRAGLSLCIVAFLVLQMDVTALAHKSMQVDLGLFACAVVLMMGQIFFLNLRWREMLNIQSRNAISFKACMLMNIAGYFANIFFIASIGGIVAKSALAVRHGVTLIHAVFATLFDRFMTLFALIVFSAMALPFLMGTLDQKVTVILAATIIFILLGLVIGVVALRAGLFREYLLSSKRRSRILAIVRLFLEDYGFLSRVALHSLLAQLCFFAGVYVLSLGIDGVHTGNVAFFALLPILALIASLPISFGGWGIREGAFIYGLGLIGFVMEDAFFLSVQVGLASLVAPFIIGLPYVLQDDFKEFLSGSKSKQNQNPSAG